MENEEKKNGRISTLEGGKPASAGDSFPQSTASSNSRPKRKPKKKRRPSANTASPEAKPQGKKGSFKGDVISLLVKIAVIICAFAAVFMFVFGVYRTTDEWMKPALHQGDIVMYYRLDKNFSIGDLAVLQYEGKTTCGRVVARGGDSIDIDHNGLKVNDNYVTEPDITYETLPYVDGFSFPQTIPPNSVFLLGDYRVSAVDSRVYGAVSLDDIEGKVIAQFRRRGF